MEDSDVDFTAFLFLLLCIAGSFCLAGNGLFNDDYHGWLFWISVLMFVIGALGVGCRYGKACKEDAAELRRRR
jgi:hypothetical protein